MPSTTKAIVLPAESDKEVEYLDEIPSLDDMQRIVGGYVDMCPTPTPWGKAMAIVNDEGILHHLHPNLILSQFCGPVILVGPHPDEDGNETPLSQEFIDNFCRDLE